MRGERHVKRAVELQPDSANFHYQLGQAYLKLKRATEAKAEFAEASKLQTEVRQGQEEKISGKLPPPASPQP